eukprot:2757990-Amphidinium_carterae.1
MELTLKGGLRDPVTNTRGLAKFMSTMNLVPIGTNAALPALQTGAAVLPLFIVCHKGTTSAILLLCYHVMLYM